MCRASHEGGRRCPGCLDPRRQARARIRQRIGRYDRAARRANAAGDWSKVEHYAALLDRDVAAYQADTTLPPAPAEEPSRAAEFTVDRTVDWTDDDLVQALGDLGQDPAAQDQIVATLEWRDQQAQVRDAELAEHQAQRDREAAAAWAAAISDPNDASPLTNPARRSARQLTPDQVCREEYDSFVYTAYLAAETECRGHLLTRDAEAAGVDPVTLFSGPAARARKHASEELRAWWAGHGRVTYSEWRFQWFGRESDRKAARTARYQSLGEAAMA